MRDGEYFNRKPLLLWDMAGTLLAYDRGSIALLPGIERQLRELRGNYRLFVTTGDYADSARQWLAETGLLPCFDEVFGDLYLPVGKPYGRVVAAGNADPRHCLAIGDRLPGDLPGDTAEIVTILINQTGFTTDAADVTTLIEELRGAGESFLDGFCDLYAAAEAAGDAGNGSTADHRLGSVGKLRYLIGWYEHEQFEAPRPLIVLGS